MKRDYGEHEVEKLLADARSVLPDDFEISHIGDTTVFVVKHVTPMGGLASLDAEHRCLSPGFTTLPGASATWLRGDWLGERLAGYRGRGWWKEMVQSAVRGLRKAEEP